MKFRIFLLLATVFVAGAADLYGREGRLTLSAAGMELREVFKTIEKQSDYMFFFVDSDIDGVVVSVNAKEVSVETLLNQALAKTGLLYSINDSYITILSGEAAAAYAAASAVPQEVRVGGTVTDQEGDPIPGVMVTLDGGGTVAITGSDGKYSIAVPGRDAVLIFSMFGYHTREARIEGRGVIDVVLDADIQQLDDVVVVGYGVQKKVNVTGSVASVSSADIGKRTVTQASNLLQGKASGISVRQGSGDPASNSASLLIRGRGTFSGAGTLPLVLVDGVEASLDAVNPADIESISILKDAASSSIYGSKAANGVILVTTKRGTSGRLTISYNGMVGVQKPTFLPEMVNSWEYAEIYNEALVNGGSNAVYTAEEIQKFKSGTDPVNYPNFDHIGHLFGSGSGVETIHTLGVRGGTAATQFLFSLGYINQQGLIKKNFSNKYDFRLNVNSRLRKNVNFTASVFGNKYENNRPISGAEGGFGGIIRGAMRNSNAIPGRLPNGFYGANQTLHPEADLDSKNFSRYGSYYFYGSGGLSWEIIDGLTVSGLAGYTFSTDESRTFISTYPITETYGITMNSLSNSWAKSHTMTLQALLEYSKSFGNHNLYVMAGTSSQADRYNNIGAFRNQFPNNEITEISAGSTAQATNNGTAWASKLASWFGRVQYNYKEKYLFEANIRYDGSSRFPARNRWGFFPSVSAGWRISEEGFFKDNVSFIDNLKLRVGWGQLGNQSIGNYPYQSLISTGANYPFGNQMSSGAAVTVIPNTLIKWETTAITNIGLDMGLFDSKLSFSIDVYKKSTSDILYDVSVSRTLGAWPSASNAGKVQNTGFDTSISYRNRIGGFSFDVSGVFSYNRNKVVRIANVDRDINVGLFTGYPIGTSYGYVSDGLFVDDNDVRNSPTQPFPQLATPGGIKLLDISGPDGVPDGVVNASYDMAPIGQPLPITTYGLTLSGEYKGFDFNIFFQGEGGARKMVVLDHFFPLDNLGNVQRDYYENRWTEKNPDPNAIYPRILISSTDFYQQNKMDYWFRNATFLRLKNVQIGYTFPERWTGKIALSRARLYVTAENLFTITNFYKGWDPEMQTDYGVKFYPLTRLFAVGVNLEF